MPGESEQASFPLVNGFIKCRITYICRPNRHYFAKMRNGVIILNVVLTAAVAVLFYLYFNPGKKHVDAEEKAVPKKPALDPGSSGCNIAYFEMDSVEANFEMAKKWKNELEKKEDNINLQLNRLETNYQEKYASFQQKKGNMSAGQIEAATNDLTQLKGNIENTKAALDQDYKTYYVQTQQEILAMIRKFCSEYNKENRYSIIISDEPGIVFYKDSSFDITKDLLAGLNEMYGKKKADSKKK